MDACKENEHQYETDKEVLVNLFSLELWKKVLDCVRNEDVLINLSNSSTVFRDILSARMTEYMFPKVWSILEERIGYANNEYLEEDEGETGIVATVCAECGRMRLSGNKSYSWALACRLVCKTWSETIDNSYSRKNASNENGSNNDWTLHFTKGQDATDFLKHFKGTHFDGVSNNARNPIVGRSIELALGHDSNNLQITKLLKLYGRHIWDCSVTDIVGVRMTSGFVAQLQSWIADMPNLKKLSLYFTNQQQFDHSVLEYIVGSIPIMHVKSLINLEFSAAPIALVNHLIENNSQIQMLSMLDMESLEYVDPQLVNSLLNLEELCIACSGTNDIKMVEGLSMSPSLKSLDLRMYQHFVSWQSIFTILEKNCKAGLKKLFIQLPPTRSDSDEIELLLAAGTLKLKLDKLEKLTVCMSNIIPFDFLLPLKDNLEYLEIEICYNATCMRHVDLANIVARTEMLKIVGHKYRLHESNIWQLFPKLKQVEYSGYFYVAFEYGQEVEQFLLSYWMINDSEYRVICTRSEWKEKQNGNGLN